MEYCKQCSIKSPLFFLFSASSGLSSGRSEALSLVHYTKGFVQSTRCYETSSGGEVSVSNLYLAHRAIPNVLVQEVKVSNPSAQAARFKVERPGITNWRGASSKTKT